MVLRAKSVIFLAAFCAILNFAQCESDGSSSDSDDDDPLREALLLIKLIRRAEFADASREKNSLSKHASIAAPLSPDPPEPIHNESTNNNTFRPDHNYRRSFSGSDDEVRASDVRNERVQNSDSRGQIPEATQISDANKISEGNLILEPKQFLEEKLFSKANQVLEDKKKSNAQHFLEENPISHAKQFLEEKHISHANVVLEERQFSDAQQITKVKQITNARRTSPKKKNSKLRQQLATGKKLPPFVPTYLLEKLNKSKAGGKKPKRKKISRQRKTISRRRFMPSLEASYHQDFFRRQNNEDMDTQTQSTSLNGSPDTAVDTTDISTSEASSTASPESDPKADLESTQTPVSVQAVVQQSQNKSFTAVDLQTLTSDHYSKIPLKLFLRNSWKRGRTARYPANKVHIVRKPLSKKHDKEQTKISHLRTETAAQDPIMFQVENELKDEMDTVLTNNQTKKNLKRFTREGGEDIMTTKPQSTLRVHLDGSSRYPIPFPKNHALCYTDPENGLCRTPV